MRFVQLTALMFLGSSVAFAQDDTGMEPPPPPPNPNFITLIDELDEAADGQWYCADVAGSDVQPGNPIQAHTCKTPTDDELFTTNYPNVGNVYVTDHDMCITATSIAVGAQLVIRKCKDVPVQQWTSTPEGKIRPKNDTTLCWTTNTAVHGLIAGAAGDHLKRTVSLQVCDDFDDAYNSWILPGGLVGAPPPAH